MPTTYNCTMACCRALHTTRHVVAVLISVSLFLHRAQHHQRAVVMEPQLPHVQRNGLLQNVVPLPLRTAVVQAPPAGDLEGTTNTQRIKTVVPRQGGGVVMWCDGVTDGRGAPQQSCFGIPKTRGVYLAGCGGGGCLRIACRHLFTVGGRNLES